VAAVAGSLGFAIGRSLDLERETEPQRVHRDPALPAPCASKPRRQSSATGKPWHIGLTNVLTLKGAAARLRHYRSPAVAAQIAC